MKKVAFLFILSLLLFSCNNENIKEDSSNATTGAAIDLDNLNYSTVSGLLKKVSGKEDLTVIKDGKNHQVSIDLSPDSIKGEDVKLFEGNPEDSISLALSPDYVTVVIHIDGNQYNYVDYKDTVKMKEVNALYKKQLSSLGRGEDSSMIRSTGKRGLGLNVTKLQNLYPEKKCVSPEFTKSQLAEVEAERSISLRSASDIRNGVVTVYILKEKGSNPIAHEITWQINNASSSIRDVNSRITFNFVIESCDYSGGEAADASLQGFRNWVQTSSKYKGDGGDIFFLVRWGGWNSSILGRSYVNTYNVRRASNSYAYGISCTTAWYPTVLSHEMGHIFGAVHVSSIFDLMYPSCHWFIRNKHSNSTNRSVINSNCQ
jgi:fragilysin